MSRDAGFDPLNPAYILHEKETEMSDPKEKGDSETAAALAREINSFGCPDVYMKDPKDMTDNEIAGLLVTDGGVPLDILRGRTTRQRINPPPSTDAPEDAQQIASKTLAGRQSARQSGAYIPPRSDHE